jgi:hypothetical protein
MNEFMLTHLELIPYIPRSIVSVQKFIQTKLSLSLKFFLTTRLIHPLLGDLKMMLDGVTMKFLIRAEDLVSGSKCKVLTSLKPFSKD